MQSADDDVGAGDGDNSDRPTFTSFWKRSKEALTARKITFVPNTTGPGQGVGPSSSIDQATPKTAEDKQQPDKALLRRAQVRKAQIQHRQRKANYVKQLELDIAEIRDLISGAERDVDALRAENDSMRVQIRGAVGQLSAPAMRAGGMPLVRQREGITMGLSFDRVLNAPSYCIGPTSSDAGDYSGPSTSQQLQRTQGPLATQAPLRAPPSGTLAGMTSEQTQLAINFILALEHICWDHFDSSDFQMSTEPTGPESGHTLMASSLALRTAPPAVFEGVIATKQNMRSVDPSTRSAPIPPDVSWQASGLTLQSLYGLASSVNMSDLDLTPVQAWFELAAQYPTDLLLRPDIMDTLKMELEGVVKCPHYGAVIERTAFESIAGRVLDPALATWRMEYLGQGGFQDMSTTTIAF
ncbi:hypothetical protein GQ53DRAFT_162040 [Thozetella sp. PMI_491]|nr:hypothetical protein GQ53DRAFT_162040 [Thozetella sp. PMI_491]